MVSHPYFSLFSLDLIVFAVPLTSGIPSFASRGRETKVSGHVVERCLLFCDDRVLVNSLFMLPILMSRFSQLMSLFSLLFLALRFELNPTGASVFAQIQIAHDPFQREGQPDRFVSSD